MMIMMIMEMIRMKNIRLSQILTKIKNKKQNQ